MARELPSLAIRRANAADTAQLAALRYRFRSELAVPSEDETTFVGRMTAWLTARIGQPQNSSVMP